MKKRFMQLAALVLVFALCIPQTGAVIVRKDGEVMIRVGLASSSKHSSTKELSAAHLENNTGFGAGYRFGYYDADLNFVELARTGEDIAQIAVLKTQNLYYGYAPSQGKTTYSDEIVSEIGVGCYHILVPEEFADYESAAAVAKELNGFVAWINGVYQVRVGAYLNKEEADAIQAGLGIGTVVGTSAYGISVVKNGTNQILFQYDCGEKQALAVMPDVTGAEDVRTWCLGYKYRGGFKYQRVGGGNLTVVNVLPLEDYVKGVACYEMGRLWPLEALKTQVVCARTYALKHMGNHNSLGFDMCNTANCQVYRGVGTNNASYGPSTISDQAVEETAGQVLWFDDSLAATYYSSSHGGASEEIANVWTSNKVGAYPYLCGVIDPYEATAASVNPKSGWKVSYSASELTAQLRSKGFGTKTTVDHLVLHYSALGNVIKLEVYWANGQKNTFKPSDGASSIRSAFGVDSIRFTVNGAAVNKEIVEDSVYTVNETEERTGLHGAYVLSASGELIQLDTEVHVLTTTKKGKEKLEKLQLGTIEEGNNEGGGVVTVSGDSYVFEGGGWGHQIGMSQYGAYAMANLGFSYDQICEFYFPGTEVRVYMEKTYSTDAESGTEEEAELDASEDVTEDTNEGSSSETSKESAEQDVVS